MRGVVLYIKHNTKRTYFSAALGVALVFATPTSAQEGEEGGSNPLTELIDNADYTAEAIVTFFPESPEEAVDNTGTVFLTQLTMQSQTSLIGASSFTFEAFAGYTTQEDEYRGAFRAPGEQARRPRYVDFNKAFISYESDNYEVSIGKDLVETGLSELYSPANRFGLVNGATPTHVRKFGVWQVGADFFIGDDTLSAKIMPFHERSNIPSRKSRWFGNVGTPFGVSAAAFDTMSFPMTVVGTANIRDRYQKPNPENWGYLLNYEGSREGFDFFGLAHYGPSIYPVIKVDGSSFAQIESRALSLGGGLAAVKDEWKFYGEGIYQLTERNQDEDFLKYVFGVSYRDTDFANMIGFDEIKPILEYAGETVTDEQDRDLTAIPLNLIVNSQTARPNKNSLLGRIEIQQNDKVNYYVGGIFDLDHKDWMTSFGGLYKPNDNLELSLGATFFNGEKTTHLGRWRKNDNVRMSGTYKF